MTEVASRSGTWPGDGQSRSATADREEGVELTSPDRKMPSRGKRHSDSSNSGSPSPHPRLKSVAPAANREQCLFYRPWDTPLGLLVSFLGFGLTTWLGPLPREPV